MAEPLLIDTCLPTPRGVESEPADTQCKRAPSDLAYSHFINSLLIKKLSLYTLNDINITANRFYHKNSRSHT